MRLSDAAEGRTRSRKRAFRISNGRSEQTRVSFARRIGTKVRPAKCKAGVGNQFAETLIPDALSSDLVEKVDAYWRAANYLSVGQVSCALVTRL
jgi:hypothetical protein